MCFGGVDLVLWIPQWKPGRNEKSSYRSKFSFFHEPWKRFPACISMIRPAVTAVFGYLCLYVNDINAFFCNAAKNRRFNILMWQKQIWFTVSSMLAISCMCSLLLMLSGLQVCFYDDSCFPGRIHLMQHNYIDLFQNGICKNIARAHCTFCCFYCNLFNASKVVWKWQYCSCKRIKKGHNKNTKLNYNASI